MSKNETPGQVGVQNGQPFEKTSAQAGKKREWMTPDSARRLLDEVKRQNPAALLAASNTVAIEALEQAEVLRGTLDKLVGECKGLYADVQVLKKRGAVAAEAANQAQPEGQAPQVPPATPPGTNGEARAVAPRQLAEQDPESRQQELEGMMDEVFGPHPAAQGAAQGSQQPAEG